MAQQNCLLGLIAAANSSIPVAATDHDENYNGNNYDTTATTPFDAEGELMLYGEATLMQLCQEIFREIMFDDSF